MADKVYRQNVNIPIQYIQLNNGQLKGLSKNPRFIRDEKFEQLKQSLQESPEFLDARPLLVYPLEGGRYIAIAGNMRLRAARELGMKTVPCYVFPENTTVEKLREYTIKDNLAYGEIDYDILKDDWDVGELQDWGMDLPDDFLSDDDTEDDSEGNATTPTTSETGQNEHAEALLDDAWRKAAGELCQQYDTLKGFTFISPHSAKIDFINFLYYGKDYPRYDSLAFHPMQFLTKGKDWSLYEGLQKVADGKSNVKGLRFVMKEKFDKLFVQTLPFGSARMPSDFPANLARDLIDEYCPDKGSYLDPCSGWGGRMVGFIASNAAIYTGFDASPYQVEGDTKIFDTFKDAARFEKQATVTCCPFEKAQLEGEAFDFAMTPPPYFDTEKYIGGEQSRTTNSNYEQWRKSFYEVLIRKVYKALKPNCVFALQIGSQSYPLLEDGKKIAASVGFEVETVRPTAMINTFVGTEKIDGEVVLILRK